MQHEEVLSKALKFKQLQNIPEAKLVLVLETPLPRKMEWMSDYILDDWQVLLVWDGNGRFNCPPRISDQLTFI